MAIQLDYEATKRRRWPWRGFVVAAIILSIAFVAKHYESDIRIAVLRAYWARKCATFTAPEDTRFRYFWADKDKVLASNPDYAADLSAGSFITTALFRPEPAQKLDQVDLRGVPRFEIDSGFLPTVFLHERVSPAGHRRIIHAELIEANALNLKGGIFCIVLDPPTLFSRGRRITPTDYPEPSERGMPARIYFGQPDPVDQSHFTFRFETFPLRVGATQPISSGTIDAWLQDDDTVKFEVRASQK